jgi:hypothetical protein
MLQLLLLGVACAVTACTDAGLVGTVASCDAGCPRDKVCEPLQGICVECASNADCATDAETEQRFCSTESHECVQCRTANDCSAAQPRCLDGKCRAASDDESGENKSGTENGR